MKVKCEDCGARVDQADASVVNAPGGMVLYVCSVCEPKYRESEDE